MIEVVIVDDSPSCRAWLGELLGRGDEFRVVGEASNGIEAISLLQASRPDVVILDVEMPGMDCLSLTRRIMASIPIPIVILSGLDAKELERQSESLVRAGALTVMEKPKSSPDPDWESNMLRAVRGASRVRILRPRRKDLQRASE